MTLVLSALQAQREIQALQGLQGLQEPLVVQDRLEMSDQQDQRVLQAHKAM